LPSIKPPFPASYAAFEARVISGGLIDKRQNSVLWMLAELSILLEAAMKIRVKRLPLTALRTFEAAARLGRF
jgi:hypothetical protein